MRNVNAAQKRLEALGTVTTVQKDRLRKKRKSLKLGTVIKKKRIRKEDPTELLGPSTPLSVPKMRRCTAPHCGNMTHNYYFCQECYYRKKYAGCEISEEWAGF